MSRVAFVLAAASVAAMIGPVSAATPADLPINAFGIPIAPQGGNTSIHQWGGVDDQFAVNPDGGTAPAPKPQAMAPMTQSQDEADADANDPGDPDPDHFDEILAI